MNEYKFFNVGWYMSLSDAESELNKLAKEGWYVVASMYNEILVLCKTHSYYTWGVPTFPQSDNTIPLVSNNVT